MSKRQTIESTVAGIPCLIEITYFTKVEGSFRCSAPSDMDYYGYVESEWNVCDRRGRAAPWLERKLTNDDRSRIEAEIEAFMTETADV